MKAKDIIFVADKVIAQEVTAKVIGGLDNILSSSPVPTPGARANLAALRRGLATSQPTPPTGH